MSTARDQLIEALPGYEVHGELGRGAWGVVFAAEHRQLGREVAVKQLSRDFADDADVRRRFVAEARLLASLDHPHIVPIYDYVERDGLCLLIMERLTGGTLRQRLRSGGLTAGEACTLMVAACAGLHHAHGKGVLHRDIKPENLMLGADRVLKVTDFGIAKVVGGSVSLATRTGQIVGTPHYIAPEQVTAEELTPATDVYAAGHRALRAGLRRASVPRRRRSRSSRCTSTSTPSRCGCARSRRRSPAELDEVTARALARDPADRYADRRGLRIGDRGGRGGPAPSGGLEDHCAGARRAGALAAPGAPRPSGRAARCSRRGQRCSRPRAWPRRSWRAGATGSGRPTTSTTSATPTTAPRDTGATTAREDASTANVPTTGSRTGATAEALRVAKAYLAAFNAGDDRRAAAYFAPGANANGNILRTRADAEAYSSGIGCYGPLVAVELAGARVKLIQRPLRQRAGHPKCDAVAGSGWETTVLVRDGRIVEFQ